MIKHKPYQRFVDYLKKASIPEYNSKYSNKIFSNHELLYLCVLREKARFSYRRAEVFVHAYVKEKLNLKRTPDHSTLHKFLQRCPQSWITAALRAYARDVKQILLDGTGFEQHYSRRYQLRIGRKTSYREFVSVIFVIDGNGTILSYYHDMPESQCLVSACKEFSPKEVYGDKGYDSNDNFRYCHWNDIEIYVPVKKTATSWLRKDCLEEQESEAFLKKYYRRELVESIISAVKRKYGASVKARRLEMQVKEVGMKLLAHNHDKSCLCLRFIWMRVSTEPKNLKKL